MFSTCAVREWAPLTDLIDRIPARIHRGLFPANLNLTCVDAVADFIALGSDAGVVFWYNRNTGDIQKLKAEITARLTCVKIVNSVEYMVAAGSTSGQVSVFQIQKELPPDLNLVAPCARAKPIQRYTIRDLHQSAISCAEWSKNGMKLFSGDRRGCVVLTEFDYQTRLSKSKEILSEAYEIIQLSVYQHHLLVCTLYRSVVCQCSAPSGQWQITQVGKKDRKQLIDCGGTFLKRNRQHPLLICGRPGLRFWVADTDGNVEKTLLFRDAVARSPTWQIPILNPKILPTENRRSSPSHNAESAVAAQNFRSLQLYGAEASLMVTHDDNTLYILNLDQLHVEAVARGCRKILDFCVCDKEIFVLEGARSLLRLAPAPEKPNRTSRIIFNPLMPPPVPLLGAAACGTVESPIEPEEQAVTSGEECFELPPLGALTLRIPIELAFESPRAEQNRRMEIFQEISKMDFDQSILHRNDTAATSSARKKLRKSREGVSETSTEIANVGGIVEIGHIADDKEELRIDDDGSGNRIERTLETKPTQMDASFCALTSATSPHINSGPQATPKPTASTRTTSPSKQHSQSPVELAQAYPKQLQVENTGVQTSPARTKNNLIEEHDVTKDYSAGQPVDGIFGMLRAATLQAERQAQAEGGGGHPTPASDATTTLQFIAADPLNDEIDSFLLDFRRAGDPLNQLNSAPAPQPQSDELNTSSEWEFLDD